ncbi:MAG: alpha/beta fold hydrolase [Nanoarchaeota archaeon]
MNTTFTSDGSRRHATINVPDEAIGGVILCHGFFANGGAMTGLAQKLNTLGLATITFDFYAHGKSDGAFEDMTVSRQVHDAEAATLALQEALGSKSGRIPLGIFGSSLGGLTALACASRHQDTLRCLGMRGPTLDFPDAWTRLTGITTPQWRQRGHVTLRNPFTMKDAHIPFFLYEDAMTFRAADLAKMIRIPTKIWQGGGDTICLPSLAEQFAKSNAETTLKLVAGADHNFSAKEDYDALTNDVAEWFATTLRGAR